MPDGRRRRARLDAESLPGDARKRRRERQRRDARKARLAIVVFVIAGFCVFGGIFGVAAMAVFVDHLPKLSRLGPIALGENSTVYARDCTKKPCSDEALGVIARVENRVSVRWKDIAPTMRSATVAVEDKRYWQHGALDWQGIARAAINNLQAGGIRQGGSTISQQLAKNLYLQREASSRSMGRKIDEAWIAVQLEKKYSKAEILTAYMNTVFYGESAYGVEAAAHTFFDRTAKQLTLPQSALLAGLPQAPSAYNPFVHPDAARARRAEVLGALRELRWISADAYARALNAPLSLKRGSYGTAASSPFVFDQVRQELNARLPAKLAARGGLRVYSTVDQRLQFAAGARSRTSSTRREIRRRRSSRSTCTTATSWRSRPRITDRPRTSSTWPRPGTALRARTFKLFALVDALRRGADPERVYYPSGYVSFPEDDPICPQPGGWSPHNADGGGGGYMSLETATVHSVNVVYAQLMRDLGPARVAATAHLLGIRSKLPLHCSMVLGADDVTPLELDERLRDDRGTRRVPPPARDPPRRGRSRARSWRARSSACRRAAWSARAWPTRRRGSWNRSCSPAPARAHGSTTGGRRPARPARPRTTATPGSAATRRTSQPACGSATARRTGRSRMSRASARSTAARSRR